ncbi:MAG: CUAEP/CCAEP-tail radical SAM (seleno)protein [Acidobacteriota bacterium]
MNILLISTYELGRQPFGLASPAAWLRRSGAQVSSLDLSVQALDEGQVRRADLVAFYLPMHTATRIALHVLEQVKALNPAAHLCAYGLYAPLNAELLRRRGVRTILGGEFEEGLVNLVLRSREAAAAAMQEEPIISLRKQRFLVPDRSGLPALSAYAHLKAADGRHRTTGYTEASRGCKHLCRHCPVVPVYGGQFRIVQPQVVLEDIRRQVTMGAEHISFGDPDFFNGPKHALSLVRALHREHPDLTYDVTIKVEHLLKSIEQLEVLRDTGCAFVTTAVESVDDRVLTLLDKGHTRSDFIEVAARFRRVGLVLHPTFVAFTPWLTLASYEDLLATVARLDLVENVAPIQLAMRLLIPAGSRLLELPEVRELVGPFDQETLIYRWHHPDHRIDALQREVESVVEIASETEADRQTIFFEVWECLQRAMGRKAASLPPVPAGRARATVPYLSEPWYC